MMTRERHRQLAVEWHFYRIVGAVWGRGYFALLATILHLVLFMLRTTLSISIFISVFICLEASAGPKLADFTITKIDTADILRTQGNEELKAVWKDLKASGGDGRIFEVIFSTSYANKIGAISAASLGGYYISIDVPPQKIVPDGGSIFVWDYSVLSKLKNLAADGIAMFAVPIGKGFYGAYLETQYSFLADLYKAAFNKNDIRGGLVFSSATDVDTLIHEVQHAIQKEPLEKVTTFINSLPDSLTENEKLSLSRFASEFDAYSAQLQFLYNQRETAIDTAYTLESSDDFANQSVKTIPFRDHFISELDDINFKIEMHSKGADKALRHLADNNPGAYCAVKMSLYKFFSEYTLTKSQTIETSLKILNCN